MLGLGTGTALVPFRFRIHPRSRSSSVSCPLHHQCHGMSWLSSLPLNVFLLPLLSFVRPHLVACMFFCFNLRVLISDVKRQQRQALSPQVDVEAKMLDMNWIRWVRMGSGVWRGSIARSPKDAAVSVSKIAMFSARNDEDS